MSPPDKTKTLRLCLCLLHRIFRFSIEYSTGILFISDYTFNVKSLAMYAFDCVIRLI